MFADDEFGRNQNKSHGKKTINKSSQTKATRKRKKQPADPHGANRLRSPSKRQHKSIYDKDGDFVYYGQNKPTQPLYMTKNADFKCSDQDAPTIEYIKSSTDNEQLVHIKDIVITRNNLEILFHKDRWLDDQVTKPIYIIPMQILTYHLK
ncbi:uncharacterized protein LOC133919201 [Phragmites australis]|uniref:uncharacterized protein LOC133919201 n=1 Tax=Phragmites australis TaxID=29695 RepID=UPI002D78572E|nr:uncharacterized protein LOC133919201 [Phragmites australis]